jgi:hypothetical protein
MVETETNTLIAITAMIEIAASNIDANAPSFSEEVAIPIQYPAYPWCSEWQKTITGSMAECTSTIATAIFR